MKKKVSKREQREQQVAQARQMHQQKEAARQEVIRAAKEAEEAAAREKARQEKLKDLRPVRTRTLSEERKSTAKAAGVKSTFVLGADKLLMTSFGKGNDAVAEKLVEAGEIRDLVPKPAFSAVAEKDISFRIDGRVRNALTDNPLHSAPEQPKRTDDLIHARSFLEQRYFGENFADNIHIQMIYSILDIEKILAVHINNIIYSLNNFLRTEGDEVFDLIGSIQGKSYDKFVEAGGAVYDFFRQICSNKRLGYLNLEVLPKGKKPDKKAKAVQVTEEELYYILVTLSVMRHMLAHGDEKENIYLYAGFRKKNKSGANDVMDRLYADRVRELNGHFLINAKRNLVLLFRAFGVKEPEKKAAYVRDYYDFTVRKSFKNTGFSIRQLREHILTDIEEAWELRSRDYDSVRGKLYPFIDFAIFRYYREHAAEADELVNRLRASFSEVEKDAIYKAEAQRIWAKLSDLIMNHIRPEMDGSRIAAIEKADPDVNESMLEGMLIGSDVTMFSKVIYLATLFIDGKEINDLLTTLIHQFENIASFIEVMKQQGLNCRFREIFELFDHSAQVAAELREINSFARMTKPSEKMNGIKFIEALDILGMKDNNAERIAELVDTMTDPSKNRDMKGIRNFIFRNVITSNRFVYLVRYGNVKKLKKIAGNRVVVSFVLKDIPDEQVIRYYDSLTGSTSGNADWVREQLADKLTGFSFEDIRDAGDIEQQEQKRQKQALVRLYLTVLYLILKNLVYTNSRYFMAFHSVERDRLLMDPGYWKGVESSPKKFEDEYAYPVFAREFLKQHPQKKRVAGYLDQNFANADNWAIRVYRNKIEHLDAVRNADLYINEVREIHSWFELYHYIMQRRIMEQFAFDSKLDAKDGSGKVISEEKLKPKTREYFGKVDAYRSYCKDFVKALNVPFAYNLPRYKNLSIDELFDRNRPLVKDKGNGKKLENDE